MDDPCCKVTPEGQKCGQVRWHCIDNNTRQVWEGINIWYMVLQEHLTSCSYSHRCHTSRKAKPLPCTIWNIQFCWISGVLPTANQLHLSRNIRWGVFCWCLTQEKLLVQMAVLVSRHWHPLWWSALRSSFFSTSSPVSPKILNPHQFSYKGSCCSETANTTLLPTALNHLELPDTYVRLLFVDNSSTFNTIIPDMLGKAGWLAHVSVFLMCSWIKDFWPTT